jgi:hypothetical protein
MAALALTVCGLFPAAAQTGALFQPADRDMIARYRPSMEGVTRCNQAAKALAAAARKDARLKAEIDAEDDQDEPDNATMAQTIQNIEKRAPIATAMLARSGCPVRDYFLIASQSALARMAASPELAKVMGESNFLPPETIAFWQKNGAAAERLLEEASKLLEFGKQ